MKINRRYISWSVFWGLLCILFMFSIPALRVIKDRNHESVNDADSLLMVKNNVIFLDGLEVYRFIPVDGGDAELGTTSNILTDGDESLIYTKKQINSFLIGETPVTFDLWNYVMYRKFPDYSKRPEGDGVYEVARSYEEWEAFIDSLNALTNRTFRLPTNDEWEYAARGGRYSHHYSYAGSNTIREVAIFGQDSLFVFNEELFKQGKRRKPNELGLYDMSGGVWEVTSNTNYEYLKEIRDVSNGLKHGYVDPSDVENAKRWEKQGKIHVSRGGAANNNEIECSLDYYDATTSLDRTGARIILEF